MLINRDRGPYVKCDECPKAAIVTRFKYGDYPWSHGTDLCAHHAVRSANDALHEASKHARPQHYFIPVNVQQRVEVGK